MPDLLLSALFVACIAAVAVGAGLIYFPAGLIVAGLSGAAVLVTAERGKA